MTTIIIIYLIGLVFFLGYWVGRQWLELVKVLMFNVKIKAHDEPLNNYYNKVAKRNKSLLNSLKIKALKKIAKQNNIIIKESQK